MSAAFSASMIVGALRLPLVIEGMIDEFDDPQRLDADHPGFGIGDGERVSRRPHLAAAGGVVGGIDMVAHEGVDRLVADAIVARLDFPAPIRVEGVLSEDLAGQPHASARLDPVLGMAHIVELDPRRFGRIGRLQSHGATTFRPHWPDMRLEAMLSRQRRAVIGDGHRQEMELNVGITNAGARADEAPGLEMIGGAEAAARAQSHSAADKSAPEEASMRKERDRLLGGDLQE